MTASSTAGCSTCPEDTDEMVPKHNLGLSLTAAATFSLYQQDYAHFPSHPQCLAILLNCFPLLSAATHIHAGRQKSQVLSLKGVLWTNCEETQHLFVEQYQVHAGAGIGRLTKLPQWRGRTACLTSRMTSHALCHTTYLRGGKRESCTMELGGIPNE